MNVAGLVELHHPPQLVWDGLQDPAFLVEALPGVQRIEVLGPDHYAVAMLVGVGAVKGIYEGEFRAEDMVEPERCVLRGSARSSVGAVDFRVAVALSPTEAGGSLVEYDAAATVTGPVAGVGQRLIAAAAKRTADQVLAAVDRGLSGPPPGNVSSPDGRGGRSMGTAGAPGVGAPAAAGSPPGAPATGQVFVRTARPKPTGSTRIFALGVLTGAAIALAGVAVGRRTARPLDRVPPGRA